MIPRSPFGVTLFPLPGQEERERRARWIFYIFWLIVHSSKGDGDTGWLAGWWWWWPPRSRSEGEALIPFLLLFHFPSFFLLFSASPLNDTGNSINWQFLISSRQLPGMPGRWWGIRRGQGKSSINKFSSNTHCCSPAAGDASAASADPVCLSPCFLPIIEFRGRRN